MKKKDAKHSNSGDAALFRNAVADVRPLQVRDRHPEPARKVPARAAVRRREDRKTLQATLEAPPDGADVETGEELTFRRDGVSTATLRKLRRGQYAVQDEIDLHGLTLGRAREELHSFLQHCLRQGYSCVRVVHGKGLGSGPRGPVLKTGVNKWLRQWDPVLAYCSARPVDGGTGAIYVLLRRTR